MKNLVHFKPFVGQAVSGRGLVTLGIIGWTLVFSCGTALAEPAWVSAFASRYPSATRLVTCGLCHKNFSQNSARNAYGNAFRAAGGPSNPSAAFGAIESADSDGDGTSNLDEIMLSNGFMPGYDCTTYTDTVNAPANLADYVDPNNIGCVAVTTSTTTTSTTTTSTTTTTVPVPPCAQPLSSGPQPSATDCLYILQAAVFIQTCDPACVCAPKGTLPTSATDALLCLKKATGQPVTLNCPC